MANVLGTNFNYTYPGLLDTQVFVKPSIQTPELGMFRILTGIESKQQLNLLNPLSRGVKAYSGCGTRTETGTGVSITNRTLEVTELESYYENCKDIFEQTIFETALRAGINRNDLTGTQIDNIITNLMIDSLRRDNFRIFSFGDTGSGDANYSMLDGLWTRLIAGIADYEVKRIGGDISGALSAGDAIGLLQNHFEGAEIILKQTPNSEKAYLVTGSIFENLMASYEANVNGTERQFALLTQGPEQRNGMPSLNYRGIPVIPVYAWDAAIEADSLGSPNRIIYTKIDNHVIGVNETSSLNQVDAWYDRDTRLYKIEAQYRMGYNYVHGDLTTISY